MRGFLLVTVLVALMAYVFSASSDAERRKRQLSLEDLISSALHIVRPIFDPSQPLESPMIPKKVSADNPALDRRDSSILGAPMYSTLRDVPICRGNSQICKFISCTAHNFKHDQNFANLNLAAQLIGDQEFRRTITRNPETINTVCQEQGLSMEQCRLFGRGFQLIDRFMGTIEKPNTEGASTSKPSHLTREESTRNPLRKPNSEDNPLKPQDDAPVRPTPTPKPTPIQPVSRFTTSSGNSNAKQPTGLLIGRGSRTWSTHSNDAILPDSSVSGNGRNPPGHNSELMALKPSGRSIINTSTNVVPYSELASATTIIMPRPRSVHPIVPTNHPQFTAVSTNGQSPTMPLPAARPFTNLNPFPPPSPPRADIPQGWDIPKLAPLQTTIPTRPYSTAQELRVPRAKSSIPEAEEESISVDFVEDETCDDCENHIGSGRVRRAADYYDQVSSVPDHQRKANTSVSDDAASSKKTANGSFTKVNCLQFIGK
ncbi:hypothetical protein Ddc_05514 [Ditylenchus destructor]|nr:hypothetical protein Ddc_05514 [Ditylenchus destructor]